MTGGESLSAPIRRSVDFLESRLPRRPTVGVILGSGLGGYADRPPILAALSYADIPGFSPCSVPGHGGRLVVTDRGGRSVAILQGRLHRYEGHSLEAVTRPVRVLAALGVKTLIVTCAAGALTDWPPGTVMLIADHLNLMGDNPLVGPGHRFVEMAEAYDPELRRLAEQAAQSLGLTLRQGVLAAVTGPSYETGAEAAMLARLGAQAVSMSTVPEVIVARSLGLRVFGLALLTNRAGTTLESGAGHGQVLAVAENRSTAVGDLLDRIIDRLSVA